MTEVLSCLQYNAQLQMQCIEAGMTFSERGETPARPKRSREDEEEIRIKKPCSACGRRGHSVEECRFKKQAHPDANHDPDISWVKSAKGKAWAIKGHEILPGTHSLDGKYRRN